MSENNTSDPYLSIHQLIQEGKEVKKQNVEYAKQRVKTKPLNEKEIYEKIGKSLKKTSIGNHPEDRYGLGSVKSLFPEAQYSPKEDLNSMVVVETIPVDDKRNIEIRVDPRKEGRFKYVATKSEILPNRMVKSWDVDWPPPIPKMTKLDLGSLDVMEDGYVNYVKSSLPGAKEGVIERLMLEAAKRDMSPYSDDLLPAGGNMVRRIGKEYNSISKEEYLDKIRKFLTTGKAGKIWSTVAPVVKPIATGLGVAGALMSPSADAAAADIVLPGAMGDLGVSDEQAELDRKYRQRIRESIQRKK